MAALLSTLGISIHAPREGGDTFPGFRTLASRTFQSTPPARGATRDFKNMDKRVVISIHAPREGGDKIAVTTSPRLVRFQSTPPARGATPNDSP